MLPLPLPCTDGARARSVLYLSGGLVVWMAFLSYVGVYALGRRCVAASV